MSTIYPEATFVQGNTRVWVVLAPAVLNAIDISTDLGAGTTLDLSYFLRDFNPQLTQNTGQAPNRLGTTVSLPVEGNTQFSPIEARYVYDPQADDSADDNKAKALLVRGLEFVAVVRKGFDIGTAAAATQKYEAWKMRAGRQNFGRSGDDEFSEYEVIQNFFPIAEPVYGAFVA